MRKILLFIFNLIFISTIYCKEKSSLVIPQISEKCNKCECVSGHWKTIYGCFTLISGNNVNLRYAPNLKSDIITKLPITRKIKVLYIKNKLVKIGSLQGRWAFVEDVNDENIKGWIFDYYIAYKNKFIKVNNWPIKKIKIAIGSTRDRYECTENGSFTNKWFSTFIDVDGSSQKGTIAGKIYKFQNIVWFKKNKPDDFIVIFHLKKNGDLKLEDEYRSGYIKTER